MRRWIVPSLILFALVVAVVSAGGGPPSPSTTSTPPADPGCILVAPPVPIVGLDPARRATGEPVANLQTALGVNADGIYGPVTAAAVASWVPPTDGCYPDATQTTLNALGWLAGTQDGLTAAAPARSSASAARGTAGECSGFAIPDYIIQRESGGNPSAANPSGAYGCAQTLLSHYSGGSCSGLDPYTIEGQRACVNILSNGGTNLAPWAATR